jgi:hypothetical protein
MHKSMQPCILSDSGGINPFRSIRRSGKVDTLLKAFPAVL